MDKIVIEVTLEEVLIIESALEDLKDQCYHNETVIKLHNKFIKLRKDIDNSGGSR